MKTTDTQLCRSVLKWPKWDCAKKTQKVCAELEKCSKFGSFAKCLERSLPIVFGSYNRQFSSIRGAWQRRRQKGKGSALDN